MTTTNVTMRYTTAAPRNSSVYRRPRSIPAGDERQEYRHAQEIALDREEGEETERIEATLVHQPRKLDHDRDHQGSADLIRN